MLEILIIISLMMVVKIGGKIINQHRCPDEQVIREYFNGRLKRGSERYDNTVAHFGVCKACSEKLAALSSDEAPDIEKHLINRPKQED